MGTIKQKLDRLQQTKDEIKAAINAKGGAIADEPFKDYPTAIASLPSGGGGNMDLAQIGYTSELNPTLYESIVYAKKIKDTWDATQNSLYRKYRHDKNLFFFPEVDVSSVTNANSVFEYSSLKYAKLDMNSVIDFEDAFRFSNAVEVELSIPNCLTCYRMFQTCASVERITLLNSDKVENFSYAFQQSTSLRYLDISVKSAKKIANWFSANARLQYALIRNIGFINDVTMYDFTQIFNWGGGTLQYDNPCPESLHTLYDSLYTYSFDREKAGYTPCSLKFNRNTLPRLTEEQKAAITAKGYTIVQG